jgi:hypothetical protein
MEKVYFKNSTANLTLSIYSGSNKLLSILPQFEDSILLPNGIVEIIVSSRLFGIKRVKERHLIDIKDGVNNVNIHIDPIFDKNFSNELFLPNLLTGIYLVTCLLNLKRSELNLAYLKGHPEYLFLIAGLLFCLFLTSSYIYWFFKGIRKMNKLPTIFALSG